MLKSEASISPAVASKLDDPMSALGHKRTSSPAQPASALPTKSGHRKIALRRRLWATSGLMKRNKIRTQPIGRVSLVQHAYQVISLAQIAGSFRGSKFRPGRYQQVSCFGASGCALAGADQARDADRRAQFPTDRPELPGRSKRAFEQAHGSPVVSQWFATQQ
jgi:hypothetical protein